MKQALLLLFASILLLSCGGTEENLEQPVGPWTYPLTNYRAIRAMAQRTGEKEITRLVGWDKDYYYFDWYQEKVAIGRGTGRLTRKQFDVENEGALTLEKGRVAVKRGQVRTVVFE